MTGTDEHARSAVSRTITRRIAGNAVEGSFSDRARLRRWSLLHELFPRLEEMEVLDLGGTIGAWRRAPVRPRHVTLVNLAAQPSTEPWVEIVQGDACDLPPTLRSRRFDLAYSNSVIEHVGGHAKRMELAASIEGAADHHWVQTPYRYFPIEPHWLFPGFQFLPLAARAVVARHWPIGHRRAASNPPSAAIESAVWVELLTKQELELCFPSSRILRERLLGMTKSLIAVR